MNNQTQIDRLAEMAREHQVEMLKLAREARLSVTPRAPFARWRWGLMVLVVLALPAAFLLVRVW